jgi:DNA-binding NarL/FixJ family response regulator
MEGDLVTPGERTTHPAIRIVIAEDQALVRRGAAILLSMEPDMEVVGQARNGVEAVELAQLLHPDVILMDLHMPLKGGVAATREITRDLPNTQILVLTTLDDDETVFEAVRAGAQAYLLKDASEDELLETIRALRRGESRLTPQIARKWVVVLPHRTFPVVPHLQRPHRFRPDDVYRPIPHFHGVCSIPFSPCCS